MILYALACTNGHRFESWFRSSAGFDEQSGRGLVACPVCQSADIAKSIMAPAVVSRDAGVSALVTPPTAPPEAALLDEGRRAARLALKAFRDKVLGEGENVGDQFPDQARKMHEGDIPHRPIHGQATVREARALIEEGVAIMPLPILPDELN